MSIIYINEPGESTRLFKFVKRKHAKDFLGGEMYFSSLYGYEEFYEGIDSELYALTYFERMMIDKDLRSIGTKNDTKGHSLMARNALKNIELAKLNDIIRTKNKSYRNVEELIENKNLLLHEHKKYQRNTFSICWFATNEPSYEPYLMWEQYAEKGGVMYETIYRNLKIILETCLYPMLSKYLNNPFKVYAGLMSYRDFIDVSSWSNEFPKGFYKEASFKNEQEFRILVETNEPEPMDNLIIRFPDPLIRLNGFIVMHPKSKNEFIQEIRSIFGTDDRLNVRVSKLHHQNYDY